MDILNKINDIFSRSWIAIVTGFVLGLILGLPILGWTIWPVQWVDTTPDMLRPEYKKEYIRMMIDSFALNSDRALAEQIAWQRWNSLGEDAGSIFIQLNGDEQINPLYYTEFSKIITTELKDEEKSDINLDGAIEGQQEGEQAAIQPTDEFLSTAVAAVGEEEKTPVEAEQEPSGILGKLGLVILIFIILIVIVGGALAYLLFIRRKPAGTNFSNRDNYYDADQDDFEIDETRQDEPFFQEYLDEAEKNVEADSSTNASENAPIAHFTTTYQLGDDLYDDSFSIDAPSPSGEFLGECGVGISDTLGSGDPKRVSAFEVWLFDKNDVQTVTKVMMAEDSFGNSEVRQKLEPKGELILLEPGLTTILETTTLQLEARLLDFHYPEDAQPPHSSVDNISLELTVWLKS